jgi:hypothetical protein
MRIALLLGLFLTATAPAWAADSCRPTGKPVTVNFKTRAPMPVYNNRLDVTGMRNLFATRGMALSGPHQRALGVTFVETQFSLSGSSEARKSGRGFCVSLDSVDATFGWDRMEVFVASEFHPGECPYAAVLDHEDQHVAINQDTLKEYAPQLRALLEKAVAEERPMFVLNPQGGADLLLQSIHQRIARQFDQFQKALAERNGRIDTNSNYDAIAALCPDWKQPQPPKPKAR